MQARRVQGTGQGDKWFDWLTRRRSGGSDDEQRRSMEEFLVPVRDAVLTNAGISPGESLLDVGAGDGLIAFGALERVGETGLVIFSDVSTDLLDYCRAFARELGVEKRCRFIEAPADNLSPVKDRSVDVVTTRSVLIYVRDKATAFREFHRVLRPGGRISIYEPINRMMHNPDKIWSYDVTPVAHLNAKLEAFFASFQDPETDPMLDFDEKDLLVLAEHEGFEEVHLELHVDVQPEHPVPWETFANTSGNPLIPTLREAIEEALTVSEATELEDHLRPLVEEGRGQRRVAAAYLAAVTG